MDEHDHSFLWTYLHQICLSNLLEKVVDLTTLNIAKTATSKVMSFFPFFRKMDFSSPFRTYRGQTVRGTLHPSLILNRDFISFPSCYFELLVKKWNYIKYFKTLTCIWTKFHYEEPFTSFNYMLFRMYDIDKDFSCSCTLLYIAVDIFEYISWTLNSTLKSWWNWYSKYKNCFQNSWT